MELKHDSAEKHVTGEAVFINDMDVTFQGQAIFLIAADSRENAIAAANKIKVEYTKLDEILTLEKAIEKNTIILVERKIERGEVEKGFADSKYVIDGVIKTGGQEHWYLETQTALVVPIENGEYKVYSSTQNPSETQIIVAEVLGIPFNKV